MIRESNKLIDSGALTPEQARALAGWSDGVNSVLRLEASETAIPAAVEALLAQRAAARTGRDWAASDALRDQITALGWTVKDTKDGQKVTKS